MDDRCNIGCGTNATATLGDKMSIFNYIPSGYQLRESQRKILAEVEKYWGEYDTFVIDAPVASGKSLLSIIISAWQNGQKKTAGILTPKTILQDQYQRDFSHIPSLKGKTRYPCKTKGVKSCDEYYNATDTYCCGGSCNYKIAQEAAKEADTAILNFHSHLFGGIQHGLYKDTLIIDEAHNLVSMLSDIYSLNIWKHKEKTNLQSDTKDDILVWLDREINRMQSDINRIRAVYKKEKMPVRTRKSLIEDVRKVKKYEMLKSGLMAPQERFHMAVTTKPYGRGKKRYECVEIKPTSLVSVPHQMWPTDNVAKIVLMSATIYEKDIQRLGLGSRRVKYIKGDSVIDPKNRPIVFDNVASMAYNNREAGAREVSNYIQQLADQHEGKGLVHLTYGMVYEFQKHLTGDRFIWHTEETREEAYREFVESKGNPILMACGMSEGIDLAGLEFEWQVVAKIMFPSLGDPLQKHFMHNDPLVYTLETVRATVQQIGRICRTPTDFGVTYIADSSFAGFYRRNFKLFPQYFIDALIWRKK